MSKKLSNFDDDEIDLGYTDRDANTMVDISNSSLVDDDDDDDDDDLTEKSRKPLKNLVESDEDDDDDDDVDADSDAGDDAGEDGDDDEKPGKTSKENDAILRMEKELEAVRLEALETKRAQIGFAQITVASRLEEIDREISRLKARKTEARKNNEYDLQDAIDERLEQLKGARNKNLGDKEYLDKMVEELKNPQKKQREEKSEIAHRTEFVNRSKKFFNPAGGDQVSDFIIAQSTKLAEEGYDITKKLHYDMIEKKLKAKWPHLYAGSGNGAFGGATKKSGVASTGQGTSSRRKDSISMIPAATLRLAKARGIDIKDKEVLKRMAKTFAASKKG